MQIDIIDMMRGQPLANDARQECFAFPRGCGRARTLELRVRGNDAWRPLAVFERRGDMQYVVRSIRLKSVDAMLERETFVYPPDAWAAAPEAMLESRVGDDVSVVTAARRWSYCLQYGPLRACRSGTHRFVIRAELLAGGLSLGVMAGPQRFWLPSSVDAVRQRAVAPHRVRFLESGDRFWLMLSNDHPDGEGASRFVVKELTGSEEFGTVIAGTRGLGIARNERHRHDTQALALRLPAHTRRDGRNSATRGGSDAALAVGELSDGRAEGRAAHDAASGAEDVSHKGGRSSCISASDQNVGAAIPRRPAPAAMASVYLEDSDVNVVVTTGNSIWPPTGNYVWPTPG